MATLPMHEPAEYSIQQAAELTGMSEHTLRYYERIGLLRAVRRDQSSGHRRYSADDISRMESMACLRATGMSIDQMRRYVELAPLGDGGARAPANSGSAAARAGRAHAADGKASGLPGA